MTDASDPGDVRDSHNLSRFVHAQERVYERALAEIMSGQKQSHWMWYIFPQFDGLGFSSTAKCYAIKSIAEAKAYLCHPVLGPRLMACAADYSASTSKGNQPVRRSVWQASHA